MWVKRYTTKMKNSVAVVFVLSRDDACWNRRQSLEPELVNMFYACFMHIKGFQKVPDVNLALCMQFIVTLVSPRSPMTG